jgi:ABC-2 type transport system ATP-binding protein
MPIITTQYLTKQFGTITAVDNVSLTVEKGEIYGFLGLNGAGKSTLIRMLLGMISPYKGQVKLFGKEVNAKFENWNCRLT